MKKCFVGLSLLFSLQSFAQSTITWLAPVPVAAASYGHMHPRIVLNGSNDPVILWGSSAAGGSNMLSVWNGSGFTTPVTLNPSTLPVFTASWGGSDMAAKGDTVYVVMKNLPEETGKVYITRSFDGGKSWSSPVGLPASDTSRLPAITTNDAGQPMVSYMRFGSAGHQWVAARSTNYGGTFSPAVLASNVDGEVCDCCPGSLVRSGNTVVSLYRNAKANVRTIWARISKDGGATFSDSLEVDNTNWQVMSCPSSGPDAILVDGELYTVFRSSVLGTRIYLSKASLSSPQLHSVDQYGSTFSGFSQQDYPRIAHAGHNAAMVWKQVVNNKSKLCFTFADHIMHGFPANYDTLATTGTNNADIAMSPGVIHVVWEDALTGSVMYRKGLYAPVSVKDVPVMSRSIDVYPNPAGSYFTISSAHITDVKTCLLIDNMGKSFLLHAKKADNGYSFPLMGVPKGLYTVQLTNAVGNVYQAKLSVN
ncbi:MAG: T9SS type A sorting domain-containing protein [Sphingobacteriales bacterium]|nr:MAG: T9SS type A sorting domain-containing protein [Sphingobacteriales bacterium]